MIPGETIQAGAAYKQAVILAEEPKVNRDLTFSVLSLSTIRGWAATRAQYLDLILKTTRRMLTFFMASPRSSGGRRKKNRLAGRKAVRASYSREQLAANPIGQLAVATRVRSVNQEAISFK
jgi:hypothetical protein